MTYTVDLIPALSDNYVYLIHDGNHAMVVDPGEAEPVEEYLQAQGLKLTHIINTHHHFDHIAGNEFLMKAHGAQLAAPEDPRIPMVHQVLRPGEVAIVGPLVFQVIAVPGHTSTHIALYNEENAWLFSGDSLFAGGCGRLFEGSPEQMWESLQRLAVLPDDTLVFCGHEYTLSNLRFAVTVDPDNVALQERLASVEALRKEGEPSIPSTIAEEKATNPFLRPDTPGIRKTIGMTEASDEEVFAKVRAMKDSF